MKQHVYDTFKVLHFSFHPNHHHCIHCHIWLLI